NDLQWQLQDAMEALHETMKANQVNEQQALAQLNKVLDAEREIKTLHMGMAIRIKNKLTPEQQMQLQSMRGTMMDQPGGPRRGQPGGPDGPGRGPRPGPGGPGPGGPGPGGPGPGGPDSLDVARAVPPVNHAQDARATTTKAGVKAQAALACLLHIK
ncbi:MAG: hypothetical protein DMF73_09915, partial [Acidobacteria bacterium]